LRSEAFPLSSLLFPLSPNALFPKRLFLTQSEGEKRLCRARDWRGAKRSVAKRRNVAKRNPGKPDPAVGGGAPILNW
jgi:hypothetical protein